MEEEGARMEEMLQMLRYYEKARSEGIAAENLELEALLSAMHQDESRATSDDISGTRKREEDVERQEILPKPFFVVKTLNGKKQKVFINICGSDKIPGPEDWEEGIPPSVEEALASNDESVHNIRLPLSCSDPLISSDHCGKPCLVHDVVYNMSVVEVAMRDKRLKVFMIDTAMSWIGQKYSTELSAEFKLPNMKYKGDSVQKQYIRAGPKGPLISEIPDVEAELEPSFPLLAKKDQLNADTLGSKQQGSFRQDDAPSSNVQSEVKAVHLVTETIQNERSTLPRVLENNAETDDPATLATMSFVGEEDIARTARKVAEENTGVDSSRLITSTPSKVEEQQTKPEVYEERPVPSADFLEKPQLPAIQTEYLGRPVEYIFLHISFPQEANLENLQVCSSNTEVYVEIPNSEAMRVPLMFPVSPENAEAELSPDNAVVTLKLPYLGVKGLYCCGNR